MNKCQDGKGCDGEIGNEVVIEARITSGTYGGIGCPRITTEKLYACKKCGRLHLEDNSRARYWDKKLYWINGKIKCISVRLKGEKEYL